MTIEATLERIADALEAIAAGGGGAAPAAKTEKPKAEKKKAAPKKAEPEPDLVEEEAPAADVPTQDEVNAAAMALNTAKGRDALIAALAAVGVEGAGTTSIAEDKRADFIAHCEEAAEAE